MWPLRAILGAGAAAAHRRLLHSATGTERLAVYAFGAASQGVLGQGDGPVQDAFEPTQVPGLPDDVVAVGAGHYHSFAITANGQVFSWGRNNEWQLGRPLRQGEYNFSSTPALVTGSGLERHTAVAACGSGVVSFVRTADGLLYAFGTSKRGQLGLGPGVAKSRDARRVELPGRVTQVAAGWGHAAAVLDDGRLFTWGWPAAGRLGHSFASSAAEEAEETLAGRCAWQPRAVELLSGVRVTQVACGFDHTLALTQNGELLSFGDNSLGQLGRPARPEGEHGPPADAAACQVPATWSEDEAHRTGAPRFRFVAAGLGHNLGVVSEGTIMSWGWNTVGQLGLGEAHAGQEVVPRPTAVYGIPKNNKAVVAAGRVHSVLVTDDIRHDRASSPAAYGRVWPCLTMCHTWGSGANGRLGTGDYADSSCPELVPVLDGEAVLDVACGLDHTLVLGRE